MAYYAIKTVKKVHVDPSDPHATILMLSTVDHIEAPGRTRALHNFAIKRGKLHVANPGVESGELGFVPYIEIGNRRYYAERLRNYIPPGSETTEDEPTERERRHLEKSGNT